MMFRYDWIGSRENNDELYAVFRSVPFSQRTSKWKNNHHSSWDNRLFARSFVFRSRVVFVSGRRESTGIPGVRRQQKQKVTDDLAIDLNSLSVSRFVSIGVPESKSKWVMICDDVVIMGKLSWGWRKGKSTSCAGFCLRILSFLPACVNRVAPIPSTHLAHIIQSFVHIAMVFLVGNNIHFISLQSSIHHWAKGLRESWISTINLHGEKLLRRSSSCK